MIGTAVPQIVSASERAGEPPPPGRAIVWMAVSVGLAVFPTFFYLPFWGPLLFTSCAVWRWVLERRGAELPGAAAKFGVFALGSGLIFVLGRGDGSTAALAFLVVLVSLKILELRLRRDYIITALLSYFLVLSGFFFNQSLPLAIYTVGALVINTLALAMACGAAAARPSLRLSLALCAQTLPAVILLFIFFPRLEGQFTLFGGGSRMARSGISGELRPGELSRLAENGEIALRVELPAEPVVPQSQMYWRGPVLIQCDGLSWSAGRIAAPSRPPSAPPETGTRPRVVSYRVTVEPHQNRWLFALDRPIASSTKEVQFLENGSVESRVALNRKLLYSLTSRLPTQTLPLPGDLNEPPAGYRQLPRSLSPKVRELAERWRKQAGTEDGIIDAARTYYRNNGFRYSLSPGAYESADPLEEFLFSRRRGFCEHYAASFATLMRTAGIPARVVLGYQGGRPNWMGSHLTVLQSDAHAWTELWLRGRGWVRIDPTAEIAPERLSLGAEDFQALTRFGSMTAAERLQQLFRLRNPTGFRWLVQSVAMTWDTLDHQWNLRVIGYGFDSQSDLLRDLGFGRFGILSGAIGIFAGMAIASGMFAFFLLLRARSGEVSDARASAVQKLYAKFCARVSKAGGPPRAPGEGPLDFAARATAALPSEREGIERVTESYVSLRYGRDNGGPLDHLRAAVRAFRPGRAHRAG